MVEQYIRINKGEYGRTLLAGEVFPFVAHGRTPRGQLYVTAVSYTHLTLPTNREV